jgi:hypothetical protein
MSSNSWVILNDGRTFTDYTQNSIKNEKIKKQYGIKNNQSYREFLTKHAEIIMKRNYNEMTEINHTPLLQKNTYDDTPKSESELKQAYLNKENAISTHYRQFIN